MLKKTLHSLTQAIDSRRWPRRPTSLNIEVTSTCDSKCIHCPRHEMDRPMRPMDKTLFSRIIDQAAEMGVPEICPNGYGEIMTIKNIGQYLEYIASKNCFKIVINTNGFRMTEEKIEILIKTRVAFLNICIDGATPEVAEKVRVGLKLNQIESNILRLMEIRRQRNLSYPKIRAGFVQIPENQHEAEVFLKKWQGKVDSVGLDSYSNRVGSLDAHSGKVATDPFPCLRPFRELNIWADGKAVLCCNDWNEEHIVGDLTKQTLSEVWNGPVLTAARKLMIEKRGHEIPVCAACNYWQKPRPGVKLWA